MNDEKKGSQGNFVEHLTELRSRLIKSVIYLFFKLELMLTHVWFRGNFCAFIEQFHNPLILQHYSIIQSLFLYRFNRMSQ